MMIELEDMKQHLNITFDDDDALITAKIEAAQAYLSGYSTKDYNDPANVTDDAKEACRQLAAALYENRESIAIGSGMTLTELPFLSAWIANNRVWAF